jgi:hypothetical protein
VTASATSSAPEAPLRWYRTEAGWRAMLGVVPLVPWAVLHLFQQWSALGGRAAWLGRQRADAGAVMTLLEVLVVASCAAWLALLLRALFTRQPPLGATVAHESRLARSLATLEAPAALLTATMVLVHAATLWLPRMIGHTSLAQVYETLRSATGTPLGIAMVAIGVSAFVLHVAAALPGAVMLLGLAETAGARQASRLVSVGLATCLLLLFTQLAGWHATGTGVLWPIRVVEVPGEAAPMD